MKLCKHCKKEIGTPLLGLKGFCSESCKKAYRRAYQASWLRKKRIVDRQDGYLDMSSQTVDSVNPHEKPSEKGRNEGLGPDDIEIYYQGQKIRLKIQSIPESQFVFVKYGKICELRHREVIDKWINEGEIERGYARFDQGDKQVQKENKDYGFA
jgi:hypothetical protein